MSHAVGQTVEVKRIMLRWSLAVGLSLVGLLVTAWGIFCLFGGPDPGAGSGREGVKYGIGFIGAGLVMFVVARVVWNQLKKE